MNTKSNVHCTLYFCTRCWICVREWPRSGTLWHLFLYYHPVSHGQESVCWTAVIPSRQLGSSFPFEDYCKMTKRGSISENTLWMLLSGELGHMLKKKNNLVKQPYGILEMAIKQASCVCIASLNSKYCQHLEALRCIILMSIPLVNGGHCPGFFHKEFPCFLMYL